MKLAFLKLQLLSQLLETQIGDNKILQKKQE
jgi:hypothetical protein